jgi:hypothetical protein
MIVLKSTQDQLLSVLQQISGIVERQHTLSSIAMRWASPLQSAPSHSPMPAGLIRLLKRLTALMHANPKTHGPRPALSESIHLHAGFFSAQKLGMRNAP